MSTAQTKRPTFFWQGLLIVLPAILLAGFGLFSLRQDRILAQHEATEEARRWATELAENLLPKSLHRESAVLETVRRFQAAPPDPEDDPILQYARRRPPLIACRVNAAGELVYPPRISPAPPPAPLDPEELSRQQREDWEAAQRATFAQENLSAAAAAFQRFLDRAPPSRFAALALYQAAVIHQLQGQTNDAARAFERVTQDYPRAVSEAGLPLGPLSQLHLLRLGSAAPANAVQGWINSLCAQAILEPSPWSRFLFEKVETMAWSPAVDPAVAPARLTARWLRVWDAHAAARQLLVRFRQAARESGTNTGFQVQWLNLGPGRTWLVAPEATESNYWLLASAEEDVRAGVRQSVASRPSPAYLGLTVEIAGKNLLAVTNDALVLAVAATPASSANGVPQARVSVHLTAPDKLYARQRLRTWWFGSLIALSTATVLLGFVTTWRAFRRQQELSEMKTNFVSSVSHELRAPIASVRLMAEELEDQGSVDRQKNAKYHRFIVQECRRLSALIENVLDFARQEQGRKQYEFEPTDLAALVLDTARLMQTYAADKQIEVRPVLRGEPVAPEVDGRALQQVLVNLLDNAIKHSPPKSAVEVGLEFANHHLRLWVEDHGEGIPADEQGRIFERFYRRGSELRRETQGVGLGLAIVRYVTEAHGGQVTVRSAVGQGSRFTVEIPCRS